MCRVRKDAEAELPVISCLLACRLYVSTTANVWHLLHPLPSQSKPQSLLQAQFFPVSEVELQLQQVFVPGAAKAAMLEISPFQFPHPWTAYC